jgi:hypothetical protein
MCDKCYQLEVVSILQNLRHLGDLRITMIGITGGGVVIPLSGLVHVEGECYREDLGHVWKSTLNNCYLIGWYEENE